MRLTLALIAIVIFSAWSTLAMAQFPPPGIYRCTTGDGAPLGTLSLAVAGDYRFSVADGPDYKEKAGDPGNGKGQLASASTSVTAQSGPLAALYHWKGSFKRDAMHHTVFTFAGTPAATCGPRT